MSEFCISRERQVTELLFCLGPISDLLIRKAYVAAYDRRLRHPAWTAEHLNKASLTPPPGTSNSGDRSKSAFVEDESLPEMFRAKLKDYFRSGYDRGHMCVPLVWPAGV